MLKRSGKSLVVLQ